MKSFPCLLKQRIENELYIWYKYKNDGIKIVGRILVRKCKRLRVDEIVELLFYSLGVKC